MREDAVGLEEERLNQIDTIDDYQMVHERHRVFPNVFENRNHRKILDISAGVGVVARNILENYETELLTNEMSPKCLKLLKAIGAKTVSFDLDNGKKPFPFSDGHFDAIISLATIEHIIHTDHFIQEIYRMLNNKGYLYISAPNYSGLPYLLPFLLTGKTFHDPFSEKDKYEFYAHVRYFTYRTLTEFVSSFGFSLDTVYLPLPKESTNFRKIAQRSKIKAGIIKGSMWFIYHLSPRWASEPVLCFSKNASTKKNVRKIIL